MRQWIAWGSVVSMLGLSGGVAVAAVIQTDEHVRIEQPVSDDVFAAGEAVTVTAPVGGELFAAGSRVSITDRVSRSVFVGGQTVTLNNGSGYNAFVAGQTVTIDGDIGHDAFVAGSSVELKPGTHIRGSLYVTGNDVTLAGTIDGDVHVATEHLSDEGAVIGGSLTGQLSSQSEFRGGSVGGDVRYRADHDVDGIETVTVGGTTERTALESNRQSRSSGSVGDGLLALASLVVFGGCLILLVPGKVAGVTAAVRGDWGRSFLRGSVTLIVAPIAAMIALATVIGWPIAVGILTLYLLELLVANALGAVALGQLTLGKATADRPWLALGLGGLIIAIVSNLPAPVSWIASLALFFGLTIPALGASLDWGKSLLNGTLTPVGKSERKKKWS